MDFGNDSFQYDTKTKGSKNRNRQVGRHPTKQFAKQRKPSQNEKAVYGLGINVCKPYTQQGVKT